MPCYSTHMPSWSGTWACTGTCWAVGTRWSMVMMRVAARGNSMGWRGRARIGTISTTTTACIACWIIVISRNSMTAWEGLRIAIHYCGFSKLPKVPVSCARLTSKQTFQVFWCPRNLFLQRMTEDVKVVDDSKVSVVAATTTMARIVDVLLVVVYMYSS